MSTPRDDVYDAVIVGGGPAGALAALGLSRRGRRVVLLERRGRGEGKTCGQCLNARAEHHLRESGLRPLLAEQSEGATARVRVHHRRHGRVVARTSPGRLVDRGRFDQALRDAASSAGALVREAVSVQAIGVEDGVGWIRSRGEGDPTHWRGRMIIGADGLRSRTARALGLAGTARVGRGYGFSFDLPHTTVVLEVLFEGDGPPDSIDLYLTDGGYVGFVRQQDRLHVAALVRAPRANADPFDFFRTTAGEHADLRRAGLHSIRREDVDTFRACGPMPWRPRRVANDHGALIGDAAGYVEPFTGEGMAWAIESAALLVDTAGAGWNPEAARRYTRLHGRSIRAKQRRCRFVGAGLARPWSCEFMLRGGRRWPGLLERLVHRVSAA